jgi:hypothetical protein
LLQGLVTEAGVNLFNWTLTDADDVSSDGKTIVSVGTRGDHDEGFIVRLP